MQVDLYNGFKTVVEWLVGQSCVLLIKQGITVALHDWYINVHYYVYIRYSFFLLITIHI